MGSLAPIPYNSRAMTRVSASANANPGASLTPVSHTPCDSTSLSTLPREAPRATRNPISWVRNWVIGHNSVDPSYCKNQPDVSVTSGLHVIRPRDEQQQSRRPNPQRKVPRRQSSRQNFQRGCYRYPSFLCPNRLLWGGAEFRGLGQPVRAKRLPRFRV
jgi:hypothetical protein